MAKINTLNYQTVASWNGNQDLFIVEQPDGTKVATPNMFRQFIESFYDDVPTEDSDNAIKSGGVYSALSGKQDVLTFDNVPTADSSNPVKSGGVFDAVRNTLKCIAPEYISSDDLDIGGKVAYTTSYFSINKGRLGLGMCMDEGDTTKYLIALLYRSSVTGQVKFVELAKNGLYISAANNQGTAAISGNTGKRNAYTIVFK